MSSVEKANASHTYLSCRHAFAPPFYLAYFFNLSMLDGLSFLMITSPFIIEISYGVREFCVSKADFDEGRSCLTELEIGIGMVDASSSDAIKRK